MRDLRLFAALPLLLMPLPVLAMGTVVPGPVKAVRTVRALDGRQRGPGLGIILSTSDGGQIFGFDINQHGNDGVLASSQTVTPSGDELVSMQTFNQNTGRITRTFAQYRGKRNSYQVDGIFAGDVGLVTHYVTPKNSIFAVRHYDLMNPVAGRQFTGSWTPPIKDVDVLQSSTDQATHTSAMFAIELKNQDAPDLIVSNVAANTFANVIPLDPNLFGLANGPQLGEYTAANKAIFALSPDGGAVGGAAPINVLIDLSTGKSTQFTGFNIGTFGAGSVNGLAVDPNTGVAATTTELNAEVELYNMATQHGITPIQLPCSGAESQGNSGAGIAVDPIHKLFLVTDPFFCDGSQGSALLVYDESGNLVEQITGFKFAIAEPPPVLNPAKRMGWTFGPAFNQLQQFFY